MKDTEHHGWSAALLNFHGLELFHHHDEQCQQTSSAKQATCFPATHAALGLCNAKALQQHSSVKQVRYARVKNLLAHTP